MKRCLRCGQKTEGTSFGPDCEKVAREEMDAFTRKQTGESLEENFDDLDSEFAGDYDQTVEEYQKQNGRSADDIGFCAETLINHGLWAAKRRR